MKRIVISLLTILLTITICFSQTTSTEINSDSIVYITSEQLKYANLIFVEHEKLLIENNLLYDQIGNYQNKLRISEKTDSLRVCQISEYEKLEEIYKLQIQDLNKHISKKDKTVLKIGCFTLGVSTILLLLLK